MLYEIFNFQRITIFEYDASNFANVRISAICCCNYGIHTNDMMQSYSCIIFVINGIFAVELLRITDSVNENSLEM